MKALAAVGFGLFVILNLINTCHGDLQVGFYRGKCGSRDVEAIVRGVVTARFIKDRSIVAALLRMHFHDCFVKGCDASILLDGASSEKVAPPNLSVRGYDIIDQAKATVELACPGVVSCADIITLATRDAVALSVGLRWRYDVPTGRRDGLVSLASNVNLPSPRITVPQAIQAFSDKGLSILDLALLLGGGHSVGVAHCPFFMDRLYNFNNTGKPDPTMSPLLLLALRFKCPQNGANTASNTANLDQNPFSSNVVDASFYNQIELHRGILQIDQELALDPATKPIVDSLATGFNFPAQFSAAMVRLGAVEVLTGTQGQIRRNCRAIN